MALQRTYIPYGGYWSSPFARWQGSLANEHSMKLAARTATAWLGTRDFGPDAFDGMCVGISVPQRYSFWGAPWMAGMIGAPGITGPTCSQACATSARMIASSALEIEAGSQEAILAVACDRTSNGPHIYYPNPNGPGGMGEAENPVWDNFGYDPYAKNSMVQTAENVAAREGITREEQDAVALMRAEQYKDALADDRAFQRRYMVPIELMKGRKVIGTLDGDEGIFPTTAEGLAKARPALEGGTVTFGAQTHPADGNAGMALCSKTRADELSTDRSISIQVLGFGSARVEKGYMPTAVVPAARQAMAMAGIGIGDVTAIKTHNPFAVNDVFFCKAMEIKPEKANNYGSPLVWGHPQGPTGLRATMELVEELVIRGGGYGLFTGCAAGDSAMSVVIKVG